VPGDQGRPVEALWGLHPAQRGAGDVGGDQALVVDHDRRVHDREHRDDRGSTGGQGGEHPGDDLRWGQRPGGVVDEDGVGVLAGRGQRGPDRGGAGVPADDDVHVGREDGGEGGLLRRRDGDDDLVHAAGAQRLDGPADQRAAAEQDQRLGDLGPQTETTPGRCDDADSVHGSGLGVSEVERADQEARTSSRRISALSSLVPSASASSLTRI
jgi:hypothetical protein